MNIKVSNIEVDAQAITPTLIIQVEITYHYPLEVILSISGKMNSASSGKTVAYINECYTHGSAKDMEIQPIGREEKERIFSSGNKYQYHYNVAMPAVLSHAAIDHIESFREKDHEKSVRFNFEFLIKTLEFSSDNARPMIRVKPQGAYSQFVIKQSDWIKRYSPLLGIGNFLLLELQIPDKHKVTDEWVQLYDRLSLRLNEMEDAIRHGDWQKAMDRSRQFYETLKIGDGKDGHKKFDGELRKLFLKDQHTDEGVQNFLDSIWKFFEYNSKFVHDKDKDGKLKPIPVTTKEDAYFAYALGVGLLNIIGKKTSK